MFPPSNVNPQSTKWVNAVEDAIETAESAQPVLDRELDALQRENNSVLRQVTSRVNSYYTNTYALYPMYQRTVPLSDIFGDSSRTINVSAPTAPNIESAETWVTVFSYDLPLAFPATDVGVRLNSAQFNIQGPSAYVLRFRWLVGGSPEGINTNIWMNRLSNNLDEFFMSNPPLLSNVSNRYAMRSGAAVSILNVSLQVSILNPSNRNASVASQSVTFHALNDEDNPTYLDMMVMT